MATIPFNPVTYPVARRGDSGPEDSGTGGGSVTSVFGRTGVVVAVSGDYTSSLVTNASTVPGVTVSDALDWLAVNGGITTPIDLTGVDVAPGPAGTFLVGGVTNSWQTLFTAPNNPLDNGKITRALNGNFEYYAGTAGKALIWNGTTSAWEAGTDFGANALTSTNALILNSGSAFIRLGLVAGSGAGVASAAATGTIRGARGSYTLMAIRNDADTSDLGVITVNTPGNALQFGSSAGLGTAIYANGGASITLNVGASVVQMSAGSLALALPLFQFNNAQTGIIKTQLIAANGVTGLTLSIIGQDCTGTTTTGGNLDLRPGLGTTKGGDGRLGSFFSSVFNTRMVWNDTGIGFFAATPVAQPARIGQATNSTGVAAVNKTMSDVTTAGVADPAKVNLNFANIADNMWNLLEAIISNYGLTA